MKAVTRGERRQTQTGCLTSPHKVACDALACNGQQLGENAPEVIERFVSKPNLAGFPVPAAYLTALFM